MKVQLMAAAVLAAVLGLLWAPAAAADCEPTFTQVSFDGFGDGYNVYMWSMRAFGGYLYVGTGHISTAQPDIPGSAELWRYDGQTWEQISDDGFGDPNNSGVRDLVVFEDMLYAGTSNEVDGAQVYRSSDGVTWERVGRRGFGRGNVAIAALQPYEDRLYAGTQNSADAAGDLWRSRTGAIWSPVTQDGFGDPDNSAVHSLSHQFEMLYAGMRNLITGTQLYRSPDGLNWEILVGPGAPVTSGFGNPDNLIIFHMQRFQDSTYFGTANIVDGFGLYRSQDGVSFERVGVEGFGNPDNIYALRMHVYEGALWLGSVNKKLFEEGASVWRSFDGDNWEEMVGRDGTYLGFGFGDVRNWGVRSFETYKGKLYIGTAQCPYFNCEQRVTGGEVWEWSGETCTAADAAAR